MFGWLAVIGYDTALTDHPKRSRKMPTSRDEFLQHTRKNRDAAEMRLRQRIEEEMTNAKMREDTSLSVELTDNPTCLPKIMEEYRRLNWTVTKTQHRDEHYLNFS